MLSTSTRSECPIFRSLLGLRTFPPGRANGLSGDIRERGHPGLLPDQEDGGGMLDDHCVDSKATLGSRRQQIDIPSFEVGGLLANRVRLVEVVVRVGAFADSDTAKLLAKSVEYATTTVGDRGHSSF